MFTEEPFITIEQLFKRWPGIPYDEMGNEITRLFDKEAHMGDSPFQGPFPQPFVRRGVERLNPKTSKIIWDVHPLDCAPYRSYDHGFDLSSLCFKVDAVEAYEKINQHVFYQTVDVNDLPEPEADSDYIPALEAARQLKMSPVAFTRYLRGHRKELPLEGYGLLSIRDRDYFYSPGESEAEDAAITLREIYINRLDWESHLKTLPGQAETEAPGAEKDAAKLRTQLAEVVAEYEAKLTKTETALNQERQARMKAEETAKGKSTDKATIGRLKKTLEAWQGALAWMIPAAVAAGQAGPKVRVRSELKPFVAEAKGMEDPDEVSEDVYFEAWRAVLPDAHCDKDDKSLKKKQAADYPPTIDEPLDE